MVRHLKISFRTRPCHAGTGNAKGYLGACRARAPRTKMGFGNPFRRHKRGLPMMKLISSSFLCLALLGGSAIAKEPVRNVSAKKHPNIAAAQKLVVQAYNKIEAAQKANEF